MLELTSYMIQRSQQLQSVLKKEPPYRLKQIERAFFQPHLHGWNDITSLPQILREKISLCIPWISVKQIALFESDAHDTYKAVLETHDAQRFESVLMRNKRGNWTLCVSSQIGCAMRCNFCATGTMGLSRSLDTDEIVDQYRFWQMFLHTKPHLYNRISNVVCMGMGEPLTNYENVKNALHTWLTYTDLGPTHITVSSVGVLPVLNHILTDSSWPKVRIAISLHSANEKRRKEIVPTTSPGFLEKLSLWCHAYEKKFGNRKHYLTFEYTLIHNVNDTETHAKELAQYVLKTGNNKINVIPYNPVVGKSFARSQEDTVSRFKKVVRSYGIDITQRKTMGADISAACGQLIYKKK